MCTNPMTKDGNTFACRKCNQCVAARRADWVSRVMAEKAVSPQVFSITLTYADDTQWKRDGATMFRYSDVAGFFKRLRKAIHDKTGQTEAIRYVVAGEMGDQFKRVHWHVIIFSSVDLLGIGKFVKRGGVLVHGADEIISRRKPVKRLNWSVWPHGFVVVQEPDEGGIKYAISYALKDQFNTLNSADQARYHKSEVYGTGMFRMSKRPMIGQPYLENMLGALEDAGDVLPEMKIPITNSKYYWFPRGNVRRYLLASLRRINDAVKLRTGRDAPQWSSLLARCADNESDMEGLIGNGEEDETEQEFARRLELRSKEQAREHIRKERLRRCGSTAPCSACLRALGTGDLAALGIEQYLAPDGTGAFRQIGAETADSLAALQGNGRRGGIHPKCQLRETSVVWAELLGSAI